MKSVSMPRYLIIISGLLLVSACGFDNTLYNARKYYKSAQGRAVQANGRPTNQAVEEYTKTIKKCGYILTEHKNSPEADDALILMAKALYYKGNSQFQAKTALESLITNFPNSPYVPEAVLFLARTNRQVNKPQEAQSALEEFILNNKWADWHAKAMFLLSDFSIEDKDYSKAQYWLERILSSYPGTQEAREAYYLLGKNQFEQKQFQQSLLTFEKLYKTRGVSKTIKLDALYYIGVNQLLVKDYTAALQTCRRLAKEEFRPDKMQQADLLKGRIVLVTGKADEGRKLLLDIAKAAPRTQTSSDIHWWLAEYDYYQMHDIKTAQENYGKVKSEFATSVNALPAQTKSTALTQISQLEQLKPESDLQTYIDKYLTAADNYLTIFEQPDSTVSMYNHLIDLPTNLQGQITLLQLKADSLSQKMDSLRTAIDTVAVGEPSAKPGPPDSLLAKTEVDSLVAKQDSLAAPKADESAQQKEAALAKLQADKDAVLADIKKKQDLSTTIHADYRPYLLFVKANFLTKVKADSSQLAAVWEQLRSDYPNNKYTNALGQLLRGETVRLIDPELEQLENAYDRALEALGEAPDSALAVLTAISRSAYPEISLKATFRLGWYYSFEVPDTTQAKHYLDTVLEKNRSSDYGMLVSRFYNGKDYIKFSFKDSKPDTSKTADTLHTVVSPDTTQAEAASPPSEPPSQEDDLNPSPEEEALPQPGIKPDVPEPDFPLH